MMCTLLPTVTGILGLIPKFFYDLSGEKRERMYAELLVRREEMAKKLEDASTEEIMELSKEQMSVGSQKQDL